MAAAAKKGPLIDEYLKLQREYEVKYGPKTIVLMTVGSFAEMYQVKNARENIGCAEEVAGIINVILTRKNKAVSEISRRNPLMAGFPLVSTKRYMDVLISHGYTVVVCDQVTPPPNPQRSVTGVYSPGTYVDEAGSPDHNNIVCLAVRREAPLGGAGRPLFTVGMSCADVSTGHTAVHEALSSRADPEFALEDAVRFLTTCAPREVLLLNDSGLSDDRLAQMLDLQHRQVMHLRDVQEAARSVRYQETLLHSVYSDTGMLTALEYLDLERRQLAALSFTLLLNYCHEHGKDIVRRLQRPAVFEPEEHLVLENNAISQLNVVPAPGQAPRRHGSLFDVVNFTSTAMGRRALKAALLAPLTSVERIRARQDAIAELLKPASGRARCWEAVEACLRGMPDLERLVRRMELKRLQPCELAGLLACFDQAARLFSCAACCNAPPEACAQGFAALRDELAATFDTSKLEQNTMASVVTSLFLPGVEPEADEAEAGLADLERRMADLRQALSDLLDVGETGVKLEHSERDGHYLSVTVRRAEVLKRALAERQQVAGVEVSELSFCASGTACRIASPSLDAWSRDSLRAAERLRTVCLDRYAARLESICERYGTVLWDLSCWIGTIDFLKSAARAAHAYKYSRPEIVEGEASYVRAAEARHPIIERLLEGHEYVPFWVDLGAGSMDIMLLYGMNASGKSSLQKGVGLNVLLAQCGMFVAAKSMELCPFRRVMTRIVGTDNLFTGQSTFAVEMGELRGILQRADSRSLVLGDEIAHGTETTSGLAIVAGAVTWLSRAGAKGVFATHLHELAKMDRVNALRGVRHYHLEVAYDEATGVLVYDRQLREGSGTASYGLEVARALQLDPGFLDLAHEIRREILGEPELVSTAKSRYNPHVYMRPCEVCGRPGAETHHVRHQRQADADGFIGAAHKNSAPNLIVLCRRCHDDVHDSQQQLVIGELKMTSAGPRRHITRCGEEAVQGAVEPVKRTRRRRLAQLAATEV